jgi:DNA-binding MarR family transcriptional regulator
MAAPNAAAAAQAAAVQTTAGQAAVAQTTVAQTATADEAAAQLGEQLGRFFRLIAAWKHRSRDEQGGDRLLLATLVRCGPKRATDLAAETYLDLSTVSRQIRSLVDRGLVERTPDPEDRRGVVLSVSPSGLAVYQAFRDQRNDELARMLDVWPGEDRHELVRLFTRLNDDFARHHDEHVAQQHQQHHHQPHDQHHSRQHASAHHATSPAGTQGAAQ